MSGAAPKYAVAAPTQDTARLLACCSVLVVLGGFLSLEPGAGTSCLVCLSECLLPRCAQMGAPGPGQLSGNDASLEPGWD